jgi:leucyl-tRNA synthetase
MIRMGGSKMSKSKGNLIAPAKYFDTVGADALRLFHLFVGPPADDFDWSEQTDEMIEGCHRFLARLWRLGTGTVDRATVVDRPATAADDEVRKATHRLIAKVSGDYERWSYNTAVAGLMEFTNGLYRYVQSDDGARRETLDEALDSMLLLLTPMCPHISSELWERRHEGAVPVYRQPWPVADPELARVSTVTMVVQVNGKVRHRMEVDAGISEEEAVAMALAAPTVRDRLGDAAPRQVIARPPRLVNIVP